MSRRTLVTILALSMAIWVARKLGSTPLNRTNREIRVLRSVLRPTLRLAK